MTDFIQRAINSMDGKKFSTDDIKKRLMAENSDEWKEISEKYAVGGRRGGDRFTINSRIAMYLRALAKAGKIEQLSEREAAPPEWGNRVMTYWMAFSADFSSENLVSAPIVEGEIFQVEITKFERNVAARRACIDHHGCVCKICGFDFEANFGARGVGFIHVHHLVPLSEIREKYQVNPIKDLIPVCPNCHAMLHRGTEISPDQLKSDLSFHRDWL